MCTNCFGLLHTQTDEDIHTRSYMEKIHVSSSLNIQLKQVTFKIRQRLQPQQHFFSDPRTKKQPRSSRKVETISIEKSLAFYLMDKNHSEC